MRIRKKVLIDFNQVFVPLLECESDIEFRFARELYCPLATAHVEHKLCRKLSELCQTPIDMSLAGNQKFYMHPLVFSTVELSIKLVKAKVYNKVPGFEFMRYNKYHYDMRNGEYVKEYDFCYDNDDERLGKPCEIIIDRTAIVFDIIEVEDRKEFVQYELQSTSYVNRNEFEKLLLCEQESFI